MTTTTLSQQKLASLIRQVLLVLFICYIPHIKSEPWWLFVVFATAIGFRLIADYLNFARLPTWIIICFTATCLLMLYGEPLSVEFFIRCFLIFIIFKCLEISSVRDVRVVIICNFYLMFAALIIVEEVWIIAYLLVAILANLSIMLKLSAPEVSLRQIGSKSSQQLLIAIPITIVLFFVFPRIVPHWNVQLLTKNSTGFSDTMSPGSISDLFNDERVAMQITSKKSPVVDSYWRGIVLSHYNGYTWSSTYNYNYSTLRELDPNETPDYEIMLEPHQKRWLFYTGYPVASEPVLLFSPNHWLIRQNKEPITQRFIYSLKAQATAPYSGLNQSEYKQTTQLPKNIDPRLTAWAKEQFAKSNKDIKVFISFLHDYIHQQGFWYTLSPPALNTSKNQMDTFWFDTQKGFCEHYASAVTYILRAAGIPARVIVGYYGGQWNPISNAVSIQQNDAHAWLEYWQEGAGWQQLDPTTFIAIERIDQEIQARENLLKQEDNINVSQLPWMREIDFYIDSMQFFSERWLIYYNPNSQQNLLESAGLGRWNTGELLQASVSCLTAFFLLLGLGYQWWQRQKLDGLLIEYHLLQKEFRKFNIATGPDATLKQQCKSLIDHAPALAPVLSTFFNRYEQLRLKQADNNSKNNKKETIALFKTLRYRLRRIN